MSGNTSGDGRVDRGSPDREEPPEAEGFGEPPPAPQPIRSRVLGTVTLVGGVVLGLVVAALAAGLAAGSGQMLLKLVSFWLVPLVTLPIFFLGRRLMSRSASDAQRHDQRPPILYLRPFEHDGERFEPLLHKAVGKWGPMIAFGKRGERVATLGANRHYIPYQGWQDRVEEELRQCQLVVLRVGRGEGFQWEVKTALRLLPLDQIVFFFPEGRFGLELLREEYAELLPTALPRDAGMALFLLFTVDDQPRFLAPSRPGWLDSNWLNFRRPWQLLREMLEPAFSGLEKPGE